MFRSLFVRGSWSYPVRDAPNKGKRTVNGWKNACLPWSHDIDRNKVTMGK